MKKIYITGIGRVTPWGINQEESEHVKHEKLIINIDELEYETPSKHFIRLSRSTQLSVLSIHEALTEAGIEGPFVKDSNDALKTGLIVSTSYKNLKPIQLLHQEAEKHRGKLVSPGLFPNTVLNSIAGQLSIMYNIQGANITLSNGNYEWWKAFLYAKDLFSTNKFERLILCIVDLFPLREIMDVCECSLPYESTTAFVLEQVPSSKERILLKLTKHPNEQKKYGDSDGVQTLIRKTKKMKRYKSLIEDKVIIHEGEHKHMLTIKKEAQKE